MTKRKCEVDFVYLLKVVEYPNENKRYNAPHLYSVGQRHEVCQTYIYKK